MMALGRVAHRVFWEILGWLLWQSVTWRGSPSCFSFEGASWGLPLVALVVSERRWVRGLGDHLLHRCRGARCGVSSSPVITVTNWWHL